MVRDQDIRQGLYDIELKHYLEDEDSIVINEFSLLNEDARIDIAVVNGALHGFEIKSDADTLNRLPHQICAYGKVFDLLWIVSGKKHLDAIKTMVPPFWGIMLADEYEGKVRLKKVRRAKRNPGLDVSSVARLLWKSEAMSLLSLYGFNDDIKPKTQADIYKQLAAVLPKKELAANVRETIKKRIQKRVEKPQIQYAGSRRSSPKFQDFRKKNLDLLLSGRFDCHHR